MADNTVGIKISRFKKFWKVNNGARGILTVAMIRKHIAFFEGIITNKKNFQTGH